MPPSPRLAKLEKTLELWYEQLDEAEQDLPMTTTPRERTAIKQQIRERILPELRKCEAKYWEALTQEARSCAVAEVDAGNAIIEVVQEVELIENQPNANYPNELMQKLQEILDELNKPETPAAAKAKLALPLVPGILSYEVELDTESSLRRAFQPIRRLFKEALEKN